MAEDSDAEIAVMDGALRLLSGLQQDEQKRVLTWLCERLGLRATLVPANRVTELRFSVGTTVQEMERELIFQTLSATHDNKTKAAELLGISLKTLHNKLKEYSQRG